MFHKKTIKIKMLDMSKLSVKQVCLAGAFGVILGVLQHKSLLRLLDNQTGDPPVTQFPEKIQPRTTVRSAEETSDKQILILPDGTFPPPIYTSAMPQKFETKDPGEFKVGWEQVPGAKKYLVRLYDHQGNLVRSKRVRGNEANIKKIPWDGSDERFTFYGINISSLNEKNRIGPEGETRQVKVYKAHAILRTPGMTRKPSAPEIEAIIIED
jgi:hypothetical protein